MRDLAKRIDEHQTVTEVHAGPDHERERRAVERDAPDVAGDGRAGQIDHEGRRRRSGADRRQRRNGQCGHGDGDAAIDDDEAVATCRGGEVAEPGVAAHRCGQHFGDAREAVDEHVAIDRDAVLHHRDARGGADGRAYALAADRELPDVACAQQAAERHIEGLHCRARHRTVGHRARCGRRGARREAAAAAFDDDQQIAFDHRGVIGQGRIRVDRGGESGRQRGRRRCRERA